MRGLAFGLVVLGALLGATLSPALGDQLVPIPKAMAHCTAPTFAGADNDMRIQSDDRQKGNQVQLPTAVYNALNAQTEWLTRNYRDKEDAAWFAKNAKCDLVFLLVNRIDVPNGQKLFVLHADGGVGTYFYLLFLYDPATQRVTAKPPILFGKWARKDDPFLKKPYVSIADLRGDGGFQIVFEERVHNGTMYNGAVYSYFDVGPQLELTRVLALEARVLDPFEMDTDNVIVRTLTRISRQRQRLDVYYDVPGNPGSHLNAGYAILESPGPSQPFRVVERNPTPQPVSRTFSKGGNKEMLVTLSMEEDDEFLRAGHTMYY